MTLPHSHTHSLTHKSPHSLTSLPRTQIASLREEEGALLAARQRRAKEREAELAESDDEIVFSDEEDE